ncbi:MAG: hypothetical protein JXA77_11410 [Bacteroidales bacterium]|nr:hypothetical protein [Bacteroidales bacterium]MBN2817444.1 hypothetical protein [Bacteroidales bacterium]
MRGRRQAKCDMFGGLYIYNKAPKDELIKGKGREINTSLKAYYFLAGFNQTYN